MHKRVSTPAGAKPPKKTKALGSSANRHCRSANRSLSRDHTHGVFTYPV